MRKLLTGITSFLLLGWACSFKTSAPNEAVGVLPIMISITTLTWLYPRKKLHEPTAVALKLIVTLLGWAAGIWGFFHMPLPEEHSDIDWFFPYYFNSALAAGYVAAMSLNGPWRRRTIANTRKLLEIPFEIGLVLIPILWPFIAIHAALTQEKQAP